MLRKSMISILLIIASQQTIAISDCKMSTSMKSHSVARALMPNLFQYDYKSREEWRGNTSTIMYGVYVNDSESQKLKIGPAKYKSTIINKKIKEDLVSAFFSQNEQTAVSLAIGIAGYFVKPAVALGVAITQSGINHYSESSKLRDAISEGDNLIIGEELFTNNELGRVLALKSGDEISILAKEICPLTILHEIKQD